jgi:hypothetical protein
VADVLNRDDLLELNPLKFYVVRRVNVDEAREGFRGGGYGGMAVTPEMKDTVVTGRIVVNLDAPPITRAPTSSAPTYAIAPQPADEPRATQAPAERAIVQWPTVDPPAERHPSPKPLTRPKDAVPASDDSRLRYDGRTFDEWRDQLRDELSTNKRREAVWALASFGASGYGPQVTETILQVARQYDWGSSSDSPVGNLKQAMIQALTGSSDGAVHVPAKDWMPILTNELRSGDERITSFAIQLMYHLMQNPPTLSKNEVPTLIEWSVDPAIDPRVRSMAVYALGMRYIINPDSDARIADRLTKGLLEKDTMAVALEALYGRSRTGGGRLPERAEPAAPEFRPELVDALLSGDDSVQNHVMEILEKLGRKAEPAVPRLVPYVVGPDEAKSNLAFHAIRAITGSDEPVRRHLQEVVEKGKPTYSRDQIERAKSLLTRMGSAAGPAP